MVAETLQMSASAVDREGARRPAVDVIRENAAEINRLADALAEAYVREGAAVMDNGLEQVSPPGRSRLQRVAARLDASPALKAAATVGAGAVAALISTIL